MAKPQEARRRATEPLVAAPSRRFSGRAKEVATPIAEKRRGHPNHLVVATWVARSLLRGGLCHRARHVRKSARVAKPQEAPRWETKPLVAPQPRRFSGRTKEVATFIAEKRRGHPNYLVSATWVARSLLRGGLCDRTRDVRKSARVAKPQEARRRATEPLVAAPSRRFSGRAKEVATPIAEKRRGHPNHLVVATWVARSLLRGGLCHRARHVRKSARVAKPQEAPRWETKPLVAPQPRRFSGRTKEVATFIAEKRRGHPRRGHPVPLRARCRRLHPSQVLLDRLDHLLHAERFREDGGESQLLLEVRQIEVSTERADHDQRGLGVLVGRA